MHINKTDLIYYIFASLALVLSFYTIVFHIGFTFLPVAFLIAGAVISLLPGGTGLKVFFFLLPLINSLPALFFNGYPFNLMAIVLFFLAGVVIGSFLKGVNPDFKDFNWASSYLIFLSILWISSVFVLLRWSNISMPSGAFLTDTPVGPGFPQSPRVSFAVIFPIITIFLFSLTPFTAALIRKYSLKKEQVFRLIIFGYFFSVLLAFYQKLVDTGFLSIAWWGTKMNQYNGGFSDFNGFGFFGGVLFLYSALALMNSHDDRSGRWFGKRRSFLIFAAHISFFGIILSGSRTAFIFVIFAFIYLMFSKVKNTIKISIPLVFILVLLFSGGKLVQRLEKTFDSSSIRTGNKGIIKVIDGFSNGRVQMIENSIPIVKKYPVSGIGAGNFIFHLKFLKYGEKFLEDLPLNQYLLFLDEIGVVGLLSFLFFIFIIIKGRNRDMYYKIFMVILLAMFVGNSLWLPEVLILFWIIVISVTGPPKLKQFDLKKFKPFIYLLIIVFILSNLVSFNSLHPSNLMSIRGLPYDFGFWTEAANSGFSWTKSSAGVLLEIDESGVYGPVKFFCGAPLDDIPGKIQVLKILKNGKPAGTKSFNSNVEHLFYIKGKPGEKFFLGVEVDPAFNLKKMGLGPESRDLGVQFFPVADGL
ncbi:MAG: O-antigen ligase family protein [Candidatus Aminicenantes bacterium]|nr:O-antigen ligase family protein [Candidatus Aminicenantes bacterium]